MKKYVTLYATLLMFVLCTSCERETDTDIEKNFIITDPNELVTSQGPNSITRNIIQDKKGNIWIASFEGIFRYDGNSFTNITNKVSTSRFFSVLEDRNGNFWFSTIGSGVYHYDGNTFRNFTTKEGLADNAVTSIFEDTSGNIWFGTGGGASRYDGKSFRSYTIKDGLPDNDVSTITEDKNGKIWFGTRGGVCYYDGESFIIFKRENNLLFGNTRSIVEDKNGNIWLGGEDGLWRFTGKIFTNFSSKFVGQIYEDKKGNIWTSSESADKKSWALSRYDKSLLSFKMTTFGLAPNVSAGTEIISNEGMIFGILEAYDGSIWFGTLNGVNRYDGKTVDRFQEK